MRFRFIIATFTSGFIYPTFASCIFKVDRSIHYIISVPLKSGLVKY